MTKITLDVFPESIDELIAANLKESYGTCLSSIAFIRSHKDYQNTPHMVQDLDYNTMLADALKICCKYYGGEV